jgi:hypothetical protein
MNHLIFLDCEFTDLLFPELVSLGMVMAGGDEHYVELDRDDPASAATLAKASDFVRHNGVLGQWGRVPGGAASREQMGLRTARWLLDHAARFGQPVLIAHDYAVDYQLLEDLIRDAGQWEAVREVVRPLNVNDLTGTFDGSMAAELAYESLQATRGLERHHALADAHALRAMCFAVTTGKRVKL